MWAFVDFLREMIPALLCGLVLRPSSLRIVHDRKTMPLLWNPESWSQRLAELEAQSGDVKEAPLRRDAAALIPVQ